MSIGLTFDIPPPLSMMHYSGPVNIPCQDNRLCKCRKRHLMRLIRPLQLMTPPVVSTETSLVFLFSTLIIVLTLLIVIWNSSTKLEIADGCATKF